MARRAIDIETLLTPNQDVTGNGHREGIHRFVADLAGVEYGVSLQVTSSYGSIDKRPLGTAVGKECARPQGNVFRLILHVLAAACQENADQHETGGSSAQLRTPPGHRESPENHKSPAG